MSAAQFIYSNMWCYMFLFIYLCTIGVVVTMPGTHKGAPIHNEVHSYNFPFFTRSDWVARDPKETTPLVTPVSYIVIHHTYIPAACFSKKNCSAAMRQMQHMHIDINQWWDIGYNFCVGSDGAAYEGRGWETLGAHALHFNNVSIGICLIGDWRNELPPDQQLRTVKALIEAGVQQGYVKPEYKLVGHRQVRATECPGAALYKEIQHWDHYTPFPRSYQDLPNVPELSESMKNEIQVKRL